MLSENAWKLTYVGENFLEITARFYDDEMEKMGEFEETVFKNFDGLIPNHERVYMPRIIEVQSSTSARNKI